MTHFADPGRTGTDGTDPHLDTGAMALHALSDEEAERFLDHLDGCSSCALELQGFRETVALLGSTFAQAPPASLRTSVLAAARRTPQLPPVVADQARHRAPAGPARAKAARAWYQRPAAWLTAAAAAAVLAVGTFGVVRSVTPTPDTQVALADCVSAAPDTRVLNPGAAADGVVRFAPSCGAAVVDVSGLPALPSGRTYQLWVLAGDQARSVTLLDTAATGQSQEWTATTRAGDTAIGITAEPTGGSPQPTSAPLWAVTLT
ncbi:hypothetical protein FDO65_16800 [Nakamurella flava]|uniref:Regulator of SigK n=1 Tax=Nakamurella flava TaxID=2576308 RepID=A0A4U6QCK7_9ACTN|nr:anti-sigma factor [Nakamurella flava]TKV57793.1 hypothetical protein FDO65_16800 [Nakamurella flava]